MDRISSMLSFVKVVEHEGFSAAARQLNLATSVVTTHVKSLEERLGVRLLNRTTRSVSLTEVGRQYYERCVQILSEIEDAEQAAQVLQSRPRGVLRLNTSPGIPAVIAPFIAEYATLYPEVTIRLTATSRMLDLVEQGYDLAIWYAAVPDPSFIVRRLASYRVAICASPDYLAKHGRPQHPSDLAHHSCLIFYDSPQSKDGKDWIFTGPDGDFPVRVSGTLETNNPDTLKGAALRGQGLIWAPTPMIVQELRSGALVPVLSDFLPHEYSIEAYYPNREHLPAKVRTFIDLLIKYFHRMGDPCKQAGDGAGNSGKAVIATREERAAPDRRAAG
jgi:DNA-binding transcriptional LysR family regulator